MPTHPTKSELTALEQEPEFQSILEDLYTEVQLQQQSKRKTHRRDPSKGAIFDKGHNLFYNPENWQRTRGVALFHEETQSILGNFSEYLHRSVAGCRRLVREESPIAVSEVEHVSGDWWIGVDRQPVASAPWFEDRLAMMKLHLPELGVWTPLAEVRAKLEHGSIARVELVNETLFADSDGRQLLTLPAGTNLLPVMDLDGKLTLRREIGL